MAARSAERDRWLALGLLLAVLALAYLALVHPWWSVPMLEVGERIDQARDREQRVQAELKQAPQIATQLRQAQERLQGRPGFLREPTAELATAGLVQRLEAAVVEASPGNRSCAITNRSPLANTAARERFEKVTVQVGLRCGTPELAAVLYALESGSPRLWVDNLNVLAQRLAYMPASEGGPGSGSGGLDVTFDLIGYLAPPPGAPPAPAGGGAADAAATGAPDAD